MTSVAVRETPPEVGAIVVDALSRKYERRWAVRRVSFAVPKGAVWALAGDNGAGKSTLLRVLAGMQRPSEGRITILAEPVVSPLPAELRRRVAYLGHQVFVYPDLSGSENIRFFMRLYERPERHGDLEAAVASILNRVGLAEAADASVRTYSRGMVQRLALGRLLAQAADVWLLDEPTTGLDIKGIVMLRGLLADLRARGGTALLATHDLPAFDDDFDHILRLRDGRTINESAGRA